MTRVSVIIPAYNGDRFIGEAIESVLQQTYRDLEIIVVDDGSSDRTQQVLQPYLDQIHYIYQDNQGVAAARNCGIQNSQGELIAFLDQDDVFLPHKLAAQVAFLQAHPHVGMVHSGWRRINANGATLGIVEPWHKAPELNLQAWVQWQPILLSAMMIRRSWLEKAGNLDTAFKQACDVDLALRLALLGCETGWLKEITVCYREHDRNDSLNTPLQADESERVLDKFFALSNIPSAIRRIEAECRYHSLVWSAWRLYLTGHKAEMAEYLAKSLKYTPFSPTATFLEWVKTFAAYSAEQGYEFDTLTLSSLHEWKQLMNLILAY